jgi:predicted enzyme related to lactoylglutathione lyase
MAASKTAARRRSKVRPAARAAPKKTTKTVAKAAPASASAAPARPSGPGSFCWNELLTTDVGAARAFYGRLFGWRHQEMDMGPSGTYTIWTRGAEHVGGCAALPPPLLRTGCPPHWLAYVEVADVDAAAKQAAALGGRLHHGPADIPGIGRFAVLADPQGAEICVFRPAPAP